MCRVRMILMVVLLGGELTGCLFFLILGSQHGGFCESCDGFWQKGVLEGLRVLAQSDHLLKFLMHLAIENGELDF